MKQELIDITKELIEKAKQWGEKIELPITKNELSQLKKEAREILRRNIPRDYLDFLHLTNGYKSNNFNLDIFASRDTADGYRIFFTNQNPCESCRYEQLCGNKKNPCRQEIATAFLYKGEDRFWEYSVNRIKLYPYDMSFEDDGDDVVSKMIDEFVEINAIDTTKDIIYLTPELEVKLKEICQKSVIFDAEIHADRGNERKLSVIAENRWKNDAELLYLGNYVDLEDIDRPNLYRESYVYDVSLNKYMCIDNDENVRCTSEHFHKILEWCSHIIRNPWKGRSV